jgi:hypothetical protein
MRSYHAVCVAVVLALVLPGCLQGGSDRPAKDVRPGLHFDADWAEKALGNNMASHDHFKPSDHQDLSTPNFSTIGWDPLVSQSKGTTAGGYFCGEARSRADGRRLAVVNSFYSGLAFVLADVTDSTHPFYVGEFKLEQESVYDVAMTPDGLHVVLAADPQPKAPSSAPITATSSLTFTDACTGESRLVGPVPANGPSVILVGIAEPTKPVIEDVFPQPVLGPHSVSTALVDGVTWIAVSVTNLEHRGSYFSFFTTANGKLSLKSTYQAPPAASSAQPIINGHVDATIAKHPVTKKTLAYLADWDAGLVILDLSGPVPMQVSQFTKFTGGGGYITGVETGNVHDAIPIDGLWDGKHYVLVGQEILSHPKDHPSGWLWILDDTDPARLSEVGKWTLPVDVQWTTSLQFSTHYPSIINRTAFMSLYHGGVWAIDLSTPAKLANPPTIGAFVPSRESPKPGKIGGSDVVGTPTVMEQWPLPDGSMIVFDSQSGLYVVRFDASQPAPSMVWKG